MNMPGRGYSRISLWKKGYFFEGLSSILQGHATCRQKVFPTESSAKILDTPLLPLPPGISWRNSLAWGILFVNFPFRGIGWCHPLCNLCLLISTSNIHITCTNPRPQAFACKPGGVACPRARRPFCGAGRRDRAHRRRLRGNRTAPFQGKKTAR